MSVFLNALGRRICRHYLHSKCVQDMAARTCPLCRAPFDTLKEVPKLAEDPDAWFKCVDSDNSGFLSRTEVVDALKAQLPLDWERFEKEMVPEMWKRWDHNDDGKLTLEELKGKHGLLEWIQIHYPNNRPVVEPPPIEQKEEWFDHWDEDKSLEIEEVELVRALIKTLKLSSDISKVCVCVCVLCVFL